MLKAQEKNDKHVTFDDESAFLSLTSNLQLSKFTQDSNEVYFQNEMSDVNNNIYVDVCDISHVAFPSSILEHQCESTDLVSNDYSFL